MIGIYGTVADPATVLSLQPVQPGIPLIHGFRRDIFPSAYSAIFRQPCQQRAVVLQRALCHIHHPHLLLYPVQQRRLVAYRLRGLPHLAANIFRINRRPAFDTFVYLIVYPLVDNSQPVVQSFIVCRVPHLPGNELRAVHLDTRAEVPGLAVHRHAHLQLSLLSGLHPSPVVKHD